MGLFGTVNYSNEYESITDGSVKSVNGAGVIAKDFDSYTRMSYNTNFTAMVNAAYKINAGNKVNFKSVFINTSSLSKREYTGYFVDGGEDGKADK